ncbi:cytochrome b5-like heme/steroid binding domain-containing protein [Aspergillus stella-maris]|uniref:cytochrome b5-like heme/steroid binding domain-containing protein n=1 Tax=Aspergillus stella-maris TaxID=1810926 RepID=UPI003CCD7BDA
MGWISLSRRPQQSLSPFAPEKVEAYVEHTEDISLAPQEAEPTPQPETATKRQLQLQPSFLGKAYPLQHPSTPDSDLPFIDPSIVTLVEKAWKENKTSPTVERSVPTSPKEPTSDSEAQIPAWIIINNIIYDCTAFQSQHPGGSAVIRNFVGQDCTWQFWRFHSQHQLGEFGGLLRVGRTRGVLNRYKEVPRFVGVSTGDDDDWGW